MSAEIEILGVSLLSVYAVDFAESFLFYHELLGLKDWSPMGSDAAYFRFGRLADGDPYGMYLVGSRERVNVEKPARLAFAFDVPSVGAMAAHLRAHGVPLAFEEPMDMGTGYFWLQARDPSGNLVEFLGRA